MLREFWSIIDVAGWRRERHSERESSDDESGKTEIPDFVFGPNASPSSVYY